MGVSPNPRGFTSETARGDFIAVPGPALTGGLSATVGSVAMNGMMASNSRYSGASFFN